MRVKELKRKAKQRIDVSYIRQLNIQSYGDDNLYPQTLHNIISASSTGSECNERYANFIEGNGFRDTMFSEREINRVGDTVDDIHALVCSDVAEYDGMAIHVNYNMFGEIVEINHIPFENCRLLEEDSYGYVSKIAVHPDWNGQKTRGGKVIKVNVDTVDFIDVFNPIKSVVLAQIEAAGGIEFYKGQVFYISGSGRNAYPRPKADRVVTEMSTDEGLSNVKYRNVRCNFLPAGMILTKKGQSIDDKDDDDDNGFSDTISKLQGDMNSSKIMEVELDSDEEKPEFVELKISNFDKAFTVTESSTIEHIYSAFGQEPWYCIRIGKVGFSGDILEDAFEYYNSIVSKQQRMIQRSFVKLFEYWHEPTTTDFSVEPLKYIRNATTPNNG